MRVEVTKIAGVLRFIPTPHRDDRGFFTRTFDGKVAADAGVDPNSFLQDSLSRSHRGVIRGLHLRVGHGEAKLVRCSFGAIFDVVVDLRAGSPTFGQWESFELNGDTQSSIFIPAGCAHGFQALKEPSDIAYRITREHDPSEDLTISFDDPDLAIPWPLPPEYVSPRDTAAPLLRDLHKELARLRPEP